MLTILNTVEKSAHAYHNYFHKMHTFYTNTVINYSLGVSVVYAHSLYIYYLQNCSVLNYIKMKTRWRFPCPKIIDYR